MNFVHPQPYIRRGATSDEISASAQNVFIRHLGRSRAYIRAHVNQAVLRQYRPIYARKVPS
jgi:hypothetical protein